MSEVSGHDATPDQPMSPVLPVAEAWARSIVEPLTRTIAEQQQQLVSQAETIGRQSAELVRAQAEIAGLGDELVSARARIAESETPKPDSGPLPFPAPPPPSLKVLPWYRCWRWWMAAGLVVVVVGSASCQASAPGRTAIKHPELCAAIQGGLSRVAAAMQRSEPIGTGESLLNIVTVAEKVC